MFYNCNKCQKNTNDGASFIAGGIAYNFCNECAELLDKIPYTGADAVKEFITGKKESVVAKNIREAKERRARGEMLWS